MLNGIDPILIFQFSKLTPKETESLSKIPIVSSIVDKIGLPPIPIYLSEKLTGLYIDSEDKNIDIETVTDSLATGGTPEVHQKALNSTVRINMKASASSLGLTLLSALADLVLPKVTSREYSISYLHGSTVIFGGLLHAFSIAQNSENDLINVTLELTKNVTNKPLGPPEVQPVNDATTLSGGSTALSSGPTGGTTPPISGPPTQPPSSAPVKLGNLN